MLRKFVVGFAAAGVFVSTPASAETSQTVRPSASIPSAAASSATAPAAATPGKSVTKRKGSETEAETEGGSSGVSSGGGIPTWTLVLGGGAGIAGVAGAISASSGGSSSPD